MKLGPSLPGSLVVAICILSFGIPPASSREEEDFTGPIMGGGSGANYSDIEDAILDAGCDHAKSEKHAPVHVNSADETFHGFNATFVKLVGLIHAKALNSSDVCFHKLYFLMCDVRTWTCQCAKVGRG